MADPLSGLAVVGTVSNIIQLLEFSGKVAWYTHKILESSSGMLVEHESLANLVAKHKQLSDGICKAGRRTRPLTEKEAVIDDLASQCKHEAESLLNQFASLKLDSGERGVKRVLKGARKATKARMTQKEMRSKYQHLSELNDQLTSRLLLILREELSEAHEHILEKIDGSFKKVLDSFLKSKEEILAAVKSEARRKTAKLDWILKSLWFATMRQRVDNIKDAYSKTYEWVLADKSHSKFRNWLEEADKLFWVKGKAGSGKSTLMKFIAGQPETRRLLQVWAGSDDVVIVDCYFWYLGTEMQKSIKGLLQSMLYQIIDQCPHLVPAICSELWNENESAPSRKQPTWTESELYAVIERLANLPESHAAPTAGLEGTEGETPTEMLQTCQHKFVFFIDGLDEYTGDQLELAEKIKTWASYPRFKICVSSRPWNAISAAFHSVTNRLCLEDLTRGDVLHYVTSKLMDATSSLARTRQNSRGEASIVNRLIETIVERAHGVFLWVYIAVRSVTLGLAEGDSIATLLLRVEAFPSDLYEFFRVILERIDGVYARQTAHALLLATAITDRFTGYPTGQPAEYDIREEEYLLASNFLTYWQLKQADGDLDTALAMSIRYYTPAELVNMKFETRQHLSACCKDLLYVSRAPFTVAQPTQMTGTSSRQDYREWLSPHTVLFLHRTVYEFIKSDFLQSLLAKNYPASLTLRDFRDRLDLARLRIVPHIPLPHHWCVCAWFFDHAALICRRHFSDLSTLGDLVQELDRLSQIWTDFSCPFTCNSYRGFSKSANYVWTVFQNNPCVSAKYPPLQTALGLGHCPDSSGFQESSPYAGSTSLYYVKRLLEGGSRPNEMSKGSRFVYPYHVQGTVWQIFLQNCLQWRRTMTSSYTIWADLQTLVKLLLEYGADL